MIGGHEIPLSHLAPGEKARIMALRGGREFRQRVFSLGLNIGGEVEMMKSDGAGGAPGPVLVRSGHTRLMLGHGMAEHILIQKGSGPMNPVIPSTQLDVSRD